MDKNEIKKECTDLILGVKLVHLVLEEAEPGNGDLAIDVIVEELLKIRKKPNCTAALLYKERINEVEIGPAYKQYIGTKMVQAAPALRIQDSEGKARIELLADKPVTMPTDTVDMGYKVIYPDGYESWSPLDVFEAVYRETTGMNFGLALEAAKMGKKIARRGWNGKGMWVIYRTGYPEGIPCNKNTADAVGIPEGTLFKVLPYLQMKCVDGSFQMWLASQSDMLADDWYIVE